jgi:hypothetical protein
METGRSIIAHYGARDQPDVGSMRHADARCCDKPGALNPLHARFRGAISVWVAPYSEPFWHAAFLVYLYWTSIWLWMAGVVLPALVRREPPNSSLVGHQPPLRATPRAVDRDRAGTAPCHHWLARHCGYRYRAVSSPGKVGRQIHTPPVSFRLDHQRRSRHAIAAGEPSRDVDGWPEADGKSVPANRHLHRRARLERQFKASQGCSLP